MSVKDLFDLSGKTALITGGSRGLGLQIAEALGEAGAKILLTSRKAADLEESAAHLQERVEATLDSLVELAADELDAWELSAMKDPRNWPRAALEQVGVYPFGLNVYGIRR